MSSLNLTHQQIEFLLSPAAIRDRAEKIFELTLEKKTHFRYDEPQLKPTVDYVLQTIHKNYPEMNIPFHSRWGHFRAGGIDRAAEFDQRLVGVDPLEKARTKLDLVITSVLLDAGAGAEWSYAEWTSHKKFARSEGLGVASYHMFLSGVMSGDRKTLRADAQGLAAITAEDLRTHFQVNSSNPLIGVEGRVALLNGLAQAVDNPQRFKDGRPGNIIDFLIEKYGREIPATAILRAVLDGFGPIWPGRLSAAGVNLGDVWMYSGLGAVNSFESLVPLHKLSQWMTYSLIEPIMESGCQVEGVENLTGLAEYRNGGLLLDTGLLKLANQNDAQKSWPPASDLIVEWRALTVHLLDRIGHEVQVALKKTPSEFPLAKVLEGGTWWAGRFLAQEKRHGGVPPLNIQSDGTVF